MGQGDIEHPAATDVRLAAGVGAAHNIGADETALKFFKRQLLHVAYFESGQVFDRCGDRRKRGRHGPSGDGTRRQQSRHDTKILALPDQSSDERFHVANPL